MKLIVGLGNPGEKYINTRHNIGFRVIDAMIGKQGSDFKNDIKFLKPQTFMNESGRAVQKMKDFYKIDNQNIIVIHDDVDLEIGKIRISKGGSSAGHKGVQSIIDSIGAEDFWRVRIGVGRDDKIATEDWVLKNFENKEIIAKIIDETTDYVLNFLSTEIKEQTINIK